MNIELLNQMVREGYVVKKQHPTAPLFLYNYTAATQYEQVWNEATLACRGLILDEQYNYVARPFSKFFNLGERENEIIPNESFEVFEKMDGSLGILYWVNDHPAIATRGSFESKQALKATELLHTKYGQSIKKLDRTKTYLFEIIYPENRIVVNYGIEEKLCLLGIIDKATGEDQPLVNIGFPVVKQFDGVDDIQLLKSFEEDNREGYVIRFSNGFRLKVKFAEYLRIHKLVTQISSVQLWKQLSDGLTMAELIEDIPDEYYNWIKTTEKEMQEAFKKIEKVCLSEYKTLENRKETAAYFLKCTYPQVLFAMLDQKEYTGIIWKMLRPVHERPYSGL